MTYADGEVVESAIPVTAGCVAADARPTVYFLETDSGVANRQVGGGCSINDLIDDETTWPNRGAFADHLETVIAELTAAHVVDNREANTLRRHRHPVADRRHQRLPDDLQRHGVLAGRLAAGAAVARSACGRTARSAAAADWACCGTRTRSSRTTRSRSSSRTSHPRNVRANSGVFIRFPDPRTPLDQRPPGTCGTVGSARSSQAWVAIFCGHEIQIYDGETGEPQKTGSVYNFDPNGMAQSGATPRTCGTTTRSAWSASTTR